jgi:Chlorophyllase enzyme
MRRCPVVVCDSKLHCVGTLARAGLLVLACAGCSSDAAPGANAAPAATAGATATTPPPSTSSGAVDSGAGRGAAPAATTGSAGRAAPIAGMLASAGRDPGSAGASAGAAAGAAGQPAADGGEGGANAGAAAPSGTPALPPVDDTAMPGPFGAEMVATAPGLDTHVLFVPAKLGENGIMHPIIVWTNGAGGTWDFYTNLLNHFASHGFFVVADKMSGGNHDPEIVEQNAGIEWAIAEANRAGGPYAGKIDATQIGVAGHSLGSIASFASAAHPMVKASIHWSAGLTGNPVGAPEEWLQGLHAPAAFFCGGAEARALPRCSGDFDNAPPAVPIFYGTVEGVDHTGVYGDPNAGQWGRAGVAWFRFTLAGDESMRSYFMAPGCTLCSSPWMGMSRGI